MVVVFHSLAFAYALGLIGYLTCMILSNHSNGSIMWGYMSMDRRIMLDFLERIDRVKSKGYNAKKKRTSPY